MSELDDVFNNALNGKVTDTPQKQSSSPATLEDVFNQTLNAKPESVQEQPTNYLQLGKDALENTFPVISSVGEAYNAVEPVVRPIVNAPVTGVGGMIGLAQGNNLQDVAANLRAGKTAGDYVAEQLPSSGYPLFDRAAQMGMKFLTDSAVFTGATEALTGANNPFPKLRVNMVPSEAVEPTALPDPIKTNAISTTEVTPENAFESTLKGEAPKPEPKSLDDIFDSMMKPEPTQAELDQTLASTETQGEFKNRLSQSLEETFNKALGDMDQGTNEPINLEEAKPDYHGKEVSPSMAESNAINGESGQFAIPDLEAMHSRIGEALSTSGEYSPIENLKADLRGKIAEDNFNDSLVIHEATKDLTPAEDEALKFMEKGKVPEVLRNDPSKSDVVKLIENPSPALQSALEKVRPWLEQSYADSKTIDPKIHHVENYIPTMYEPGAIESSPEFINRFKTKAGFTNERAFANIADAMDAGIQPKYNKGSEILKAYATAKNEAIRNIQFREALKKLPGEIIKPDAKAPTWDSIPSLKGYKVNPAYAKDLAFLNKDRVSQVEQGFRSLYDPLAGKIKTLKFLGGLFHGVAMAESGLQLVGPVNMLTKFFPELFRSARKGGAAFIDPKLTRRMLRANVNFSVSPDVEGEIFEPIAKGMEAGLREAGKKLDLPKAAGLAAKAVDKATIPAVWLEKFVSKSLWNHEQAALKTMGFKVLSQWAAKKYPEMTEVMRDRQVGEILNDAFGSQSWELLMKDPSWQKFLQRVFMAPDYWISTLRMFGRGFVQGGLKGAASRRWVMNGITYLLGGAALFNYGMTKHILGKGKWPWENEEGKKLGYIFYGKDEKGHNMYFQVSKPFLEAYHLLSEPSKTIGNKLNPVIQTALELLTGKTVGGFDMQKERPGFAGRVASQMVSPIALSGNAVGGIFPKSQGMSYTRLETGLKEAIWKQELAIRKGNTKEAQKAQDEINSLQQQATDNNIHGLNVERKVREDVKAQLRREEKAKGNAKFGSEFQSFFDKFKADMRKGKK